MFALLAALVFAVWGFGGHLGSLNLEAIGLVLLALEFAVAWGRPYLVRTRPAP